MDGLEIRLYDEYGDGAEHPVGDEDDDARRESSKSSRKSGG